jgi:hypothetical protein
VARSDDYAPAELHTGHDIVVHRVRRGRYVLHAGDELRECADRDLEEALRQALGLDRADAEALAAAVRAGARDT